MIFNNDAIAHSIVWIAYLSWNFAVVFQIILNYRRGSTKGLSDWFILANLNTQFLYTCACFALDLPFTYKLLMSLNSIWTFLWVVQRFYYIKKSNRQKICKVYFFDISSLIFILCLVLKYPQDMGLVCGNLAFLMGVAQSVPQIYKNLLRRSIKGFSFGFVCMNFFAHSLEMGVVPILGLPFYVVLNDVRGLVVCGIFLIQFFVYGISAKKYKIKA